MNAPLIQLIYTSHACEELSVEELVALLDRARTNNAVLAVTGMLLYSDNRFIQVLEGERNVVEELYEKVRNDPRHEFVRKVTTRQISVREFPDWSMGFRQISADQLATLPQLNDFFNENFDPSSFRKFGSPAHFLLLAFRDVA